METILHLLLSFVPLIFFSWYWIATNKTSPVYVWPFLGMLPSLFWNASNYNLHDFLTQALKRTGGTFLLKGPSFINADYIVTSDAMNCHHIFSRNSANYHKGHDFKIIMEALGDGIFNVDGDSWKFQRQLLHSLLNNSEFESHTMRTLRFKMESTLFQVLDDASKLGTVLDMQDVSKRFMFDNICTLVLGFDPCCLTIDGLSSSVCDKAFEDLEEAAAYRHLVPIPVWKLQNKLDIGMERKVIRAWKIMDQFLYGNIKAKKEALLLTNNNVTTTTTNKAQKLDLLTQILLGKEEEDHKGEYCTIVSKKSDKFLRDTALTLIAAGRDTVSSGLTWLLWLVATHPDVEKKIVEEIKQVIATRSRGSGDIGAGGINNNNGLLSKYELSNLLYLHATVCETFRLYPPVPFEHKCAIEADVLPSGHMVERGTRFLFSIYSMGRMEETWGKDCMEFKPERWISDRGGIIHVPSYKFMTFLAGARTCLGKNMAFMQVKTLASSILYNYKFRLVEGGHLVRPTTSMVMVMKDGLKTRVSKRDH
ncbi:Alkane hydroxylase MAH1 [Linum grandiflorum]